VLPFKEPFNPTLLAPTLTLTLWVDRSRRAAQGAGLRPRHADLGPRRVDNFLPPRRSVRLWGVCIHKDAFACPSTGAADILRCTLIHNTTIFCGQLDRGLRLALCVAWGGIVAGGAWVAYQAVGAWGWPVTAGRKVRPYLIPT
jgi:hypothetical protein